MDDHRLARIESKLDDIDHKLDSVMERLPTFVTWRNLGATAVTLATLTIAFINLA